MLEEDIIKEVEVYDIQEITGNKEKLKQKIDEIRKLSGEEIVLVTNARVNLEIEYSQYGIIISDYMKRIEIKLKLPKVTKEAITDAEIVSSSMGLDMIYKAI